jgi:hypothetical protein
MNISPLTTHNVLVTVNFTAFGYPTPGSWPLMWTLDVASVWVYFTRTPWTALLLSDPIGLMVGTRNVGNLKTQYRNVTRSLDWASLGADQSFGIDDDEVSY